MAVADKCKQSSSIIRWQVWMKRMYALKQ